MPCIIDISKSAGESCVKIGTMHYSCVATGVNRLTLESLVWATPGFKEDLIVSTQQANITIGETCQFAKIHVH